MEKAENRMKEKLNKQTAEEKRHPRGMSGESARVGVDDADEESELELLPAQEC